MHPEYQAYLTRLEETRSEAFTDLFIGRGTELVSVPDTVCHPDDDSWIDEVEYFNNLSLMDDEVPLSVPRTNPGRYLYWVKYVALTNVTDLQQIAAEVTQRMGVSEEAIGQAMDSFPGT